MTLPKLSTDAVVLFTTDESIKGVGLITRLRGTHAGEKSLPGVLIQERESVEAAARRAAEKIAGLDGQSLVKVTNLPLMEDPFRDMRGDTRSLPVLFAVRDYENVSEENIVSLSDAWSMPLAFDHAEILYNVRQEISRAAHNCALLPELTGITEESEREFTSRFARRAIGALTGTVPNPGNLNRVLKNNYENLGISSGAGTLWRAWNEDDWTIG